MWNDLRETDRRPCGPNAVQIRRWPQFLLWAIRPLWGVERRRATLRIGRCQRHPKDDLTRPDGGGSQSEAAGGWGNGRHRTKRRQDLGSKWVMKTNLATIAVDCLNAPCAENGPETTNQEGRGSKRGCGNRMFGTCPQYAARLGAVARSGSPEGG